MTTLAASFTELRAAAYRRGMGAEFDRLNGTATVSMDAGVVIKDCTVGTLKVPVAAAAAATRAMVEVTLRTASESNLRDWKARSRRSQQQRMTIKRALPGLLPPLPAIVTLTRLGPKLLDSDNLQGALKAVRDGIADRYQVDDGDGRYEWNYAQEKAKGYAVRVEIAEVPA